QTPQTPQTSMHSRHRRHAKRWMSLLLLLAVLGLLGVWGGRWLQTRLAFVHETDARIVADMVAVASRVEGWVVTVPVEEGQRVSAGDVVARIDDRTARLQVAELRAEEASIAAERERVAAERRVIDARTSSRLKTQASQLSAAEALVESFEFELGFASAEYERNRKLSQTGVVPKKELERTRTVFQRARQDLLKARADMAAAQAELDEVRAERGELDVLDQTVAMLAQKEKQYAARRGQLEVALSDHVITSVGEGVVSRVFVVAGEYIRTGQRVALMHDPNRIWIEANIRETSVGRLEVGQPVRVVVDAYPDLDIEGRVERIGHATTGEFALLPNPNPSGNFTKVTQRLPVRISVEQHHAPRTDGGPAADLLRPGMLVEVYVRTD
ncbi:MAG: HlyD family secretion protein, partial [Gammaproteobacteria bacterium]|nr:HlyD family secretion protein [Gammaproteobacteria bacterium]